MALRKIKTTGIADDAITAAKIADDAISSDRLSANSVGASELADDTVASANIIAGAIVNTDINASAAIDATKLADGSVTSTELQYINSLSSNAQTQITNTVTVANAALPKAGGTMSGAINMADQELLRPILRDYVEPRTNMAAAATVTLDMTNGNVFALTPDQNTTFTFSNPPVTGRSGAFTLIWFQDSSDRTITWPVTVTWAGGTAPDVTSGSGKCDIYTFFTLDAGSQWFGFQAGADMG